MAIMAGVFILPATAQAASTIVMQPVQVTSTSFTFSADVTVARTPATVYLQTTSWRNGATTSDYLRAPMPPIRLDFAKGAAKTKRFIAPTRSGLLPDTSYSGRILETDSAGTANVTVPPYLTFQTMPAPVVTPSASFTAAPQSGDVPLTVQFTDTSSGTPTSWAWNFGDGSTSTEQSPSHVYATSGTFTAQLTATNSAGSSIASTTIVTTDPVIAPVASFDLAPSTGDAPLTVQFTNTSTGTVDSRLWEFGDGTSTTEQNPSHVYTAAANYTAKLTVTNAGGSSTATRTVSVTTPPAPPAETLFGANWGGAYKSTYEPVDVYRSFYTTVPAWTDAGMVANGKPVNFSFKYDADTINTGSLDATFRAFFQNAPTNKTYYWTYYHEPEDNIANGEFTKAAYIAAWQRIYNIAHEPAVYKSNIKSNMIYSDWTLDSRSGRDWHTYYPGNSYVDVLSWDVYEFGENNTTVGDEQTMAQHVASRNFLAANTEVGKPFAIPELGYNHAATRPAWLLDMAKWAQSNGALFVAYFDFDATNTGGLGNHTLYDAPSQQLWKDVCSGAAFAPGYVVPSATARFPGDPGNGVILSGSSIKTDTSTVPDGATWMDDRITGDKRHYLARLYGTGTNNVMDWSAVDAQIAKGRLPLASAKYTNVTPGQIAAGANDAQIIADANAAKARAPKPLWLSYWHEPFDDFTVTNTTGNTAADFRAAFRRIVQIYKNQGVTNVAWFGPSSMVSYEYTSGGISSRGGEAYHEDPDWKGTKSCVVNTVATPCAADWYTGTQAAIDIFSIDQYSPISGPGGSYSSYSTQFNAFKAKMDTWQRPWKPYIVAELGTRDTSPTPDWAAHWQDVKSKMLATNGIGYAIFNYGPNSSFYSADPTGVRFAGYAPFFNDAAVKGA